MGAHIYTSTNIHPVPPSSANPDSSWYSCFLKSPTHHTALLLTQQEENLPSAKEMYYNRTDYNVIPLRPESSENIPIRLQEADLYFSNQNDLRNPKMGSKQSVVVATEG